MTSIFGLIIIANTACSTNVGVELGADGSLNGRVEPIDGNFDVTFLARPLGLRVELRSFGFVVTSVSGASNGKVHLGDRILAVNRQSVHVLHLSALISALNRAALPLVVSFSRGSNIAPQRPPAAPPTPLPPKSSPSSPSPAPHAHIDILRGGAHAAPGGLLFPGWRVRTWITVQFDKRPFGINLREETLEVPADPESPPGVKGMHTVVSVNAVHGHFSGTNAEMPLKDDIVATLNGLDILEWGLDRIMGKLSRAELPISVGFRRVDAVDFAWRPGGDDFDTNDDDVYGGDELFPITNPCSALALDEAVSLTELKRAYKRAALKWHPDKHSGASAEARAAANARFIEVQASYELLRESPSALEQCDNYQPSLHRHEYYPSGSIIVTRLSDDNFDRSMAEARKTGYAWFVQFYMPRCKHCKFMRKVVMEVARRLKNSENALRVRMAVVNCYSCDTELCPLCKHHGINFFPTLRLYLPSGNHADFEHHTHVPYESIPAPMLHFVKRQMASR